MDPNLSRFGDIFPHHHIWSSLWLSDVMLIYTYNTLHQHLPIRDGHDMDSQARQRSGHTAITIPDDFKCLRKFFEITGPHSTQMVRPEWQVWATIETVACSLHPSTLGNLPIIVSQTGLVASALLSPPLLNSELHNYFIKYLIFCLFLSVAFFMHVCGVVMSMYMLFL